MDRLRDGRDDPVKAGDWRVWRDDEPRAGELNMALDEALMAEAEAMGCPLLRLYRWAGAAVSFGYFDRLAAVEARFPSCAAVRRWTGGGAVDHRADVTFALAVPRGHPLARVSPLESYRHIHQVLLEVLQRLELPAALASSCATTDPAGKGRGPAPCFVAPVCADVLLQGEKIAGGAQRRTRMGLLHQGSLQSRGWSGEMRERLRDELAAAAGGQAELRWDQLLTRGEEIARQKYATRAWLARW